MSVLQFYVFSYNRGDFLANCVRSIEDCAPWAAITVLDDGSVDGSTRAEITRLEHRHRVIHADRDIGHKHGGLYVNMQAALELAPPGTLACFVQDDTQLVRSIAECEAQTLLDRFDRCAELAFLSATFLKGIALARKGGMAFTYDPELDLYFPRPARHSAGIYYSDVSIAHIDRLRSNSFRFATGEPANQAAAAERFGPMGYLRCPFLMWLPNAPAYRGRTKSFTLRWAERRRRSGIHPLRYMTDAEVHRLATTTGDRPPVAEQWLEPVSGPLPRPWIYDPLHGSQWLKYLNRLELLARSPARVRTRRRSRAGPR